MKDVWEMFRLIVEQRKRREVDPTIQLLRQCLAQLESNADAYTQERLQAMADFFETGLTAYDEVKQVSPQGLRSLVKVRGKIRKLLGLKTK